MKPDVLNLLFLTAFCGLLGGLLQALFSLGQLNGVFGGRRLAVGKTMQIVSRLAFLLGVGLLSLTFILWLGKQLGWFLQ